MISLLSLRTCGVGLVVGSALLQSLSACSAPTSTEAEETSESALSSQRYWRCTYTPVLDYRNAINANVHTWQEADVIARNSCERDTDRCINTRCDRNGSGNGYSCSYVGTGAERTTYEYTYTVEEATALAEEGSCARDVAYRDMDGYSYDSASSYACTYLHCE